MDICRNLAEKLHSILRQLREVHEGLDELEKTRIELENSELLQKIEDIRILLRILSLNGRIVNEKLKIRMESLNPEQADQ